MREAIAYAHEITSLINEINFEEPTTRSPQKAAASNENPAKSSNQKSSNDNSKEDSMEFPDLDLTVTESPRKESKKTATPEKQITIKTEKQQPVMLPPPSILPAASFMPPPLHSSSMFQPPQITSTIIAQSLMPPSETTNTQTRQSRSTASKKTGLNSSQQRAATTKKTPQPTPFNYNNVDTSFMSQMSQSQSKKRNSSRRNNKGETQLHLAVMNVNKKFYSFVGF